MRRSSLNPAFGNHYYRVTQPFTVLASSALMDSNTSIGSSRMLGIVYRRVTARPGDEIHALVGGTFLIRQDIERPILEVTLNISEKHPFEKVYLPPFDEWPMDKLAQVDVTTTRLRAGRAYRVELPRLDADVARGLKHFERSIDAIVEENDGVPGLR